MFTTTAKEEKAAFGVLGSVSCSTIRGMPKTVHQFVLLHDTSLTSQATFDSALYDTIKANPPDGCTPTNFHPYFGLECARLADSKWQAVTELIAEIRGQFGLVFNDLGIEKLYEWYGPDPNGPSLEFVVQLLAMASERATLLGLTTEDLTQFLQNVAPVEP